jgi:HEAT repeat protein
MEALDAFERIENAASISADEIAPIVDAARCRFVRVWEIGADLLNRLAVRHEKARNAIVKMLRDRKAEVRFQAIALLGLSRLPASFAASLIQMGLHDRSHQVRGKVAEAACQFALTDLIADLEASLIAERHAIARQSLEFAVALLRDGYLLQRTGGKLTNVWVRRERNRGWCISVPITDDDLRTGKLDTIIARAKAMP